MSTIVINRFKYWKGRHMEMRYGYGERGCKVLGGGGGGVGWVHDAINFNYLEIAKI